MATLQELLDLEGVVVAGEFDFEGRMLDYTRPRWACQKRWRRWPPNSAPPFPSCSTLWLPHSLTGAA
jgi:hypothetical protein